MLGVLIGIVGFLRIPETGEKIALPGNGAALDMNAVDEAVLDMRSAPIAAPDQAAALRELPEEGKVAFP